MDPITHGLTGALLAEAGFHQRYGRQATLALAGGALLPDIDIVWSWGQGVAALEMHRGVTHSLLGAAALALALAAAVRWLGPERRWGPLIGMALLGVGVGHLLLDLVTSFGIQLFLPFSRARPALDWLFIIDLWLSIPILLAFLIARVTGVVRVAHLGCVYVAVYLGLSAAAHASALAHVQRAAADMRLPITRVAALPQPPSPLSWLGLVETADGYGVAPVKLFASLPARLELVPRGPDSDLVQRVRTLAPVQTYLWFARFPVVRLREIGDQQVVEFRDLRFTTRGWRENGFVRRVAPLVSRSRLEREPFVLEVAITPSGAIRGITLQ